MPLIPELSVNVTRSEKALLAPGPNRRPVRGPHRPPEEGRLLKDDHISSHAEKIQKNSVRMWTWTYIVHVSNIVPQYRYLTIWWQTVVNTVLWSNLICNKKRHNFPLPLQSPINVYLSDFFPQTYILMYLIICIKLKFIVLCLTCKCEKRE